METILDLTPSEARRLLMKESSFFTMELPPYFTFKAILSECARTYRRHPTTLNSNDRIKRNYTTETPHNYSDLNYAIVHNKDGDYAWRPFQMINPMIYTELAHMLTARGAWWELRKRFEKLQADPRIKCLSIPLRPSKSPTKTTILHWWREIEQASIHNALSWHYMATTDITDFYPSVYTHTIPWALHTKKVAKNNRRCRLLGNRIDSLLQDIQNRQTNGIPQGNLISDLLAELLLAYADDLLLRKIDEEQDIQARKFDFEILRYRDDYRIFTNSKEDAKLILRTLSEILQSLNLKMNANKTDISSDIVQSAIKPDKYYWITQKTDHASLYRRLVTIYDISKRYKNSGTTIRLLSEFRNDVESMSQPPANTPVLVSILTSVMLQNPRTYPIVISIISLLLESEPLDTVNGYLTQIHSRFQEIPNTAFLEIWLQRMTLVSGNLEISFKETICTCVQRRSGNVWNFDWLEEPTRSTLRTIPIVDSSVISVLNRTIDRTEVDHFTGGYPHISPDAFDT